MINKKIAVIGIGYVGLPLAVELSNHFNVIGYDANKNKINNLNSGKDLNQQYSAKEINKKNLSFTNDQNKVTNSNIYIVCVPTPITKKKLPNLKYLKKASILIGKTIKKNETVIFESTVYPGCTEEICIPLIEKYSSLKINADFYCGYSPERINPGDKINKLSNIKKIISASSKKGLKIVRNIYEKIIFAGLHEAESIKVAEAAKILENIQRSINISLINEVSLIFRKLKINTYEVLNAASTKWNFIKFKPGLVGGHCIAIDPYYLTYKAKKIGVNPKLILSGQNINNYIPLHIAKRVSKKINLNKKNKKRILVLGITFKEDCPDIRHSKVFDIIDKLVKNGALVDVYDPWIKKNVLENKIKFKMIESLKNNNKNKYDSIILAVSHKIFKEIGFKKIKTLMKKKSFFFDVKSLFYKEEGVECL
jgi:UDP-N-acetyl-D-glucosamine/UDP-N-acetyl-D-galactosamine dehydrogenase